MDHRIVSFPNFFPKSPGWHTPQRTPLLKWESLCEHQAVQRRPPCALQRDTWRQVVSDSACFFIALCLHAACLFTALCVYAACFSTALALGVESGYHPAAI
eukprot:1139044-Pelagomonas_calceolata.AAC.3